MDANLVTYLSGSISSNNGNQGEASKSQCDKLGLHCVSPSKQQLPCKDTELESFCTSYLEEWLLKEKEYQEQCQNMLLKCYVKPIRKWHDKASKDIAKKINLLHLFSQIEPIANLSRVLVTLLQEAFAVADPTATPLQSVLSIWFTIAPFLRIYSDYVGNFALSLWTFDNAMECFEFRRIVEKLQLASNSSVTETETQESLTLRELLGKPVSRLVDYFHSMQQLHAAVAEGNQERQAVVDAAKLIYSVMDEIIASIRNRTMDCRMHKLSRALGGAKPDLLSPSRTLQVQASLTTLYISTKEYLCEMLVFSDLLLFVQKSPDFGLTNQDVGAESTSSIVLELSLDNIYVNIMEDDPLMLYLVQISPKVQRFLCRFRVKVCRDRVYHEISSALSQREDMLSHIAETDDLIMKARSSSCSTIASSHKSEIIYKRNPKLRNWSFYWSRVMQSLKQSQQRSRKSAKKLKKHQAPKQKLTKVTNIMGREILFGHLSDKVRENIEVQQLHFQNLQG